MNRTEFMNKISRIMSMDESNKVLVAYLMAKKFHKGQVRKELGPDGQPLRYFEHLRRTACILLDSGYGNPELIITALLHDSIEDSDEAYLLNILTEEVFGGKISRWIRNLTKVDKENYLNDLKSTMSYCFHMEKWPGFIVVKAADRLDNLRSLPVGTDFAAKQIKETMDYYIPLFQQYIELSKTKPYHSKAYDIHLNKFSKIFEEIKSIVNGAQA